MSSNSEAAFQARLTPRVAKALADYLESLVESLRRHARSEEATLADRQERRERLQEAITEAQALIAVGARPEEAARKAAVDFQFQFPASQIAANVEHEQKVKARRQKAEAIAQARRLYQQGRSIRAIAEATGIPRTTAHRILRQEKKA